MIKRKEYIYFFFTFVLYFILIKTNLTIQYSNDSINLILNALIIKSKIFDLNLIINDDLFYPLFYSFVISNLISAADIFGINNCLKNLELCGNYFNNIIYFQSILLFLTALVTFFTSQIIFNNKKISYCCFILVILNSFYLSRIFFISSEVLSLFFLTLNFFLIVLTLNSNKNKFFVILILSSSILFLLKPIFLIINIFFFFFLFLKKKINKKIFLLALIFFSLTFSLSNYFKKTFFNNVNFNYEMTVIEQRTAYGYIDYNEIIPLIISFIPKIGDDINRKIFNVENTQRVALGENGRNFFYNNRSQILNKLNDNITIKDIVLINISNFDKQLILTPIFLFRGIFMQSGFNDFFRNIELTGISIFIIFNYIFYSLVKIYLLYICFKSFFSVNQNITNLYLAYPSMVFLVHAILTHNLPRYSSILFVIGVIFLVQKIYTTINYEGK